MLQGFGILTGDLGQLQVCSSSVCACASCAGCRWERVTCQCGSACASMHVVSDALLILGICWTDGTTSLC